jgi:hypothetical protein
MSIFKGKNAPKVVSRCRRGKSSRQCREEDEGSPANNLEMRKREVRQVMSRRRRSFPSSKTVVSKKEVRQVMGNVCDVKGRGSWRSGRPLFRPRNAELQL